MVSMWEVKRVVREMSTYQNNIQICQTVYLYTNMYTNVDGIQICIQILLLLPHQRLSLAKEISRQENSIALIEC